MEGASADTPSSLHNHTNTCEARLRENALVHACDQPRELKVDKKMAKRRLSSSAYNPLSKTRRTGIDPEWNHDFPWMVSIEAGKLLR